MRFVATIMLNGWEGENYSSNHKNGDKGIFCVFWDFIHKNILYFLFIMYLFPWMLQFEFDLSISLESNLSYIFSRGCKSIFNSICFKTCVCPCVKQAAGAAISDNRVPAFSYRHTCKIRTWCSFWGEKNWKYWKCHLDICIFCILTDL